MPCNCIGPCVCAVDEVNTDCPGTSCPISIPILPPCTAEEVVLECPRATVLDRKAAILTSQDFNIPLCGSTITIYLSPMPVIHVGAYFWSSVYGGFKIVASTEDTLTLLNQCVNPLSPAGTFVPKNSTFILIPDPLFIPGLQEVFLAVDFTAPAVGDCTTAKFTSIDGIPIGSQVTFGGVTYWFTQYLGGGVVVLCNMGAGASSGQLFKATNFFGEFIYPVTVLTKSVMLESENSVEDFRLDANGPTQDVLTSITVSNPYSYKNLSLYYAFKGSFNGEAFQGVLPKAGVSPISLEVFVDGTLTFLKSLNHLYDLQSPPISPRSFEINGVGVLLIPPLQSRMFESRVAMTWTGAAPAATSYIEGDLFLRGSIFGVFP